jgi:quercetin dioxygenase-like cupin family protein
MSSVSIAANKAVIITPAQLVWMDVPLVQGGQAAVLFGNPTKAGTTIMRFKFPANRQTPAHTHPYAEIVTIISGSIGYGEGNTFDTAKGELGKPGTFAIVPAQQAHFVWTENEEAIVQIQFEGPASTNYVNAADDPRSK